MGSPPLPIAANIFFNEFEHRALAWSEFKAKIWWSYVDDRVLSFLVEIKISNRFFEISEQYLLLSQKLFLHIYPPQKIKRTIYPWELAPHTAYAYDSACRGY